ncbi:hydroxymethylpyrimidine ABC transporter substrate-binding protein [Halarcobacter mediterraneus]|uniref:Thiamine pyrimidine synthase n=1 Tax=Halarcobacter mediterraneus TaxID=2023153 RepID=A0A4Q1AWL8_9BACT|nr:ABC transporter substrate-binding protein [Halarcobacter mediterraneus]RXK14465.1 hydroxymethylpyrimidine ABC transporter substrate-binding protein [Halarcobacter mediterraneus]
MMNLKIALEWFMNPDHLPFIAGVYTNAYLKEGLEVELIEPKEHYDGFKELTENKIDIHINEPIHLFEHYFEGIKSLGTFFETDGGVLVRKESVNKLKENKKFKITTPEANEITNRIGFEILNRYAKKEGFELDRKNIEFVQKDFWHINNLKEDETLDAAWLCFYNFEAIEASYEGFEFLFIDQKLSPYPNFSALELISTNETFEKKFRELNIFMKVTKDMMQRLQDVDFAKDVYYKFTEENKSELMDKIIEDTITRFNENFAPSDYQWKNLYSFLEELNIIKLTKKKYESIWYHN